MQFSKGMDARVSSMALASCWMDWGIAEEELAVFPSGERDRTLIPTNAIALYYFQIV